MIEMTNFSDTSTLGHNQSRFNIERFTRISEHQMLYSLTADQHDTYQTPYTRKFILDLTPDPIFKYACHERSDSTAEILRGAREQERFAFRRL